MKPSQDSWTSWGMISAHSNHVTHSPPNLSTSQECWAALTTTKFLKPSYWFRETSFLPVPCVGNRELDVPSELGFCSAVYDMSWNSFQDECLKRWGEWPQVFYFSKTDSNRPSSTISDYMFPYTLCHKRAKPLPALKTQHTCPCLRTFAPALPTSEWIASYCPFEHHFTSSFSDLLCEMFTYVFVTLLHLRTGAISCRRYVHWSIRKGKERHWVSP